MSYTAVLTEEAKEEIHDLLSSRRFYVGVNGKFTFSAGTDIIDLTLASMTS